MNDLLLLRLVTFVPSAALVFAIAVTIWRKLTPQDEQPAIRFLFLAALPVPAAIRLGTIPLHDTIYRDNAALGSYTSILAGEVSIIFAIYLLVIAAAFAFPLWPFVAKLIAWPNRARSILRAAFSCAAGVQAGGLAATAIWSAFSGESGDSSLDKSLDLTVLLTSIFSSIGELISLAGELAILFWFGVRARRWVVGLAAGYSLSLFQSSAIWLLPKSMEPSFLPSLDLSTYIFIFHGKAFVAAFISVAILSWIFVQSDDDSDVRQGVDMRDTTLPDPVTSSS